MNAVADAAINEFGSIDILCANAGIMGMGWFVELSTQTFQVQRHSPPGLGEGPLHHGAVIDIAAGFNARNSA